MSLLIVHCATQKIPLRVQTFFGVSALADSPEPVLGLSHKRFYPQCRRIEFVRNDAHRLREMLVEARKAATLTQTELSLRLNRPQSFVSKYERGERRLDVVEFGDVVKALGLDPLRFLRRFYSEES
jgi:hypothetical protein